MSHAVEYFHSLVEHDFSIDQYEVSYNKGRYHVTITIENDGYSPMSYYVYMMYQKKMERCLENYVKPENLRIQVVLPPKLIKENLRRHYEKLEQLLRVTPSTNN